MNWTADRVAVLEEHRSEIGGHKKIAAQLGCSVQAVRRKCEHLGHMTHTRNSGWKRGSGTPWKKPDPPSPEVIAERDLAFSHVMTPNQLILGDPLPGRCAALRPRGMDDKRRDPTIDARRFAQTVKWIRAHANAQ